MRERVYVRVSGVCVTKIDSLSDWIFFCSGGNLICFPIIAGENWPCYSFRCDQCNSWVA